MLKAGFGIRLFDRTYLKDAVSNQVQCIKSALKQQKSLCMESHPILKLKAVFPFKAVDGTCL